MEKLCPVCASPFKDGDDVVACMLSKFKVIPSDASYAIEHPTACLEIVHLGCSDWRGLDIKSQEDVN